MTSSVILKILQNNQKVALKPYFMRLWHCDSLINIRPIAVTCRYISTSKKDKDTATLTDTLPGQTKSASLSDVEARPKNWISYGFGDNDIVEDRTLTHLIFFLTVTLCVVGCSFLLMFQPDNRMIDWCRREAFLELRRREANGLPLIDVNIVPAEQIELPTDEELEDVKLII